MPSAEGARAMLTASRQSGPFPIISSIPCTKIFGPRPRSHTSHVWNHSFPGPTTRPTHSGPYRDPPTPVPVSWVGTSASPTPRHTRNGAPPVQDPSADPRGLRDFLVCAWCAPGVRLVCAWFPHGALAGHPQEIIDFWGGAYMPQMGRPSTPLYLRGFAPRSYVKRPVQPSPDTGWD